MKFNVLLITKLMDTVPITLWLLIIVKLFKLIVMAIVMIPLNKEMQLEELIMDPIHNVQPVMFLKKDMFFKILLINVINSNVLMVKFLLQLVVKL
jgi:type IV secretory pathway VirB3-like protein